MKTKIILIGLLVMFFVSGCDKAEPTPKEEIISCDWCRDYHNQRITEYEHLISKVCECYNRNNITYTIDFGCDGKWYQCKGLTFEDKKQMAMIDDHWYCICDETVIVTRCEDIEIDNLCEWESHIYEEEVNRTTEFVWSY